MYEIIRCLRCNRILTSEKSINRGYGLICYHKMQLEEAQRISPNNEVLDRIRKLELDRTYILCQLKHKVFVGKSQDSELEWDLKPEIKQIKNETKIQLIVVIKELKVKFQIGPDETFDYHSILKPINVRETPEAPPLTKNRKIVVENLELITN